MLYRSLATAHKNYGRGLLALLLALWHEVSETVRGSVERAVAALVAAVPAERRNFLAPILTSGLVQTSANFLPLHTLHTV